MRQIHPFFRLFSLFLQMVLDTSRYTKYGGYMSVTLRDSVTKLAATFLEPANATHRQYEALRAYFVDGLPSNEAARRFGYSTGGFRVLCHHFRQNPKRKFFLEPAKGPKPSRPKDDVRTQIIAMRKQRNLSIYEISEALKKLGRRRSPAAVAVILKEEGFGRLPRRRDEERVQTARPEKADKADVRQLSLEPRTFRTQFGGLFLFLPYLARIPLDRILGKAGFPGTKMIPAACAVRSLLGLKLFGSARRSHVMSYVHDDGLALFAGLNVIPKRSFLTEYSCRIKPGAYPALMKGWFESVGRLGIDRGVSFDLDFHTIPYHGDDALVEKHYVSKRSRRQKGILAFLAQDADHRVFCYAEGTVKKEDQNDEILRFIGFWKQRTAKLPEELVFDSKLTTYGNLSRINAMRIKFMTLRRRSKKMVHEIHLKPLSAWRRIELEGVARVYRTPRVLDETITLKDYDGPLRQLTITDLGHEEPTLLLTNHLRTSPRKLIGRYAQRMIIENGIADGIDFFHMDALSSAVAMKINCDLQLTLMASSLYKLLGRQIGNGYERARSRKIFRDFVEANAHVEISERDICVHFQKRAHNPLLLAAGVDKIDVKIPWLGRRRLNLILG